MAKVKELEEEKNFTFGQLTLSKRKMAFMPRPD